MSQIIVKRPNDKNHIAVFFDTFSQQQLENPVIVELLALLNDNAFNLKFTYAIYTDQNFLTQNLLLPIFHTYYLNGDKKYVILQSINDLPGLYPHHQYVFYGPKDTTQALYDMMLNRYPDCDFKQIESIGEIL